MLPHHVAPPDRPAGPTTGRGRPRRRRTRYRALLGPLLAAVLVAGAGLPAAATAHNHAPDAPTDLVVNGMAAPLAVDGTVQFGWSGTDPDDDEMQSAYQIMVRDADDATVWDSGRVASDDRSWIAYAGPALAPETVYTWTVRVHDRAGAVSDWAAPATWRTGLGDDAWSGAAWIARSTSGNDAKDEWTLARTELQVAAGSPVTGTRVYVAAQGDWQVDVDGAQVARGQGYDYAGEGTYDVAAVDGVRAGQVLAVGVRHHYWTCTCQGRANGPTEAPSAMLVKVVVDHADGTRDVAVSGPGWTVARDTSQDVSTLTWRNSDSGERVEHQVATGARTGWDTAGYDDSAWSAPVVVGAHPRPGASSCSAYEGASSPCTSTHLTATETQLTRTVVHPVQLTTLADGDVFVDFGQVVSAVPRVHLAEGVAGRRLTLTTSYRQANGTLAAATARRASRVSLAAVGGVEPGDTVTVDAPADGYGAGDPETRTVTAVDGTTLTLDTALKHAHDAGAWVQWSRAGTSALDTQGSDMRFYYTEADGDQTAEAFTYWGFRYLQISDPGETLTVDDVAAVVQHTAVDPDHAATFTSSDDTLDAVFDLMVHSATSSAQNVFLDTPTREKGQFLGDAVDISYATMDTLGERNLTRRAIRQFIASQNRYWSTSGRLNAVYPNGDAARDIPDYTEMFPDWVMRYYRLTGDEVLLAEALPAMEAVAGYVAAHTDATTGLVTDLTGGSGAYQYGIVDWPAAMRYDTVVSGNGARTVVNALAVGVYDAVAEAEQALGDDTAAQRYTQRSQALVDAVNARLRDPATGLYADGLASGTGEVIDSYSQHSQTYAVAYGIADARDHAAIAAAVAAAGMAQGPMTLRQLLAALRVTGATGTAVALLTDAQHDGPAQVLAEGGTFLWEQWTPGCASTTCTGAQVLQTSSESFSHGWGAAGASEMLQGLLGVTVTGAGGAQVEIAPPAAGLERAEGSVWTERGRVQVRWRHGDTGYRLVVEVPDDVTATVVVPVGQGTAVTATGGGDPRAAGATGTTTSYTVGSGRTVFTATW